MELKTYFAQDRAGNIVPNATVTIYLTGTNTLATGLKTVAGAALTNPFTATADGKIQFQAPDGIYDMQIAYSTQTGARITIQCLDLTAQRAAAEQAASEAKTARDQTQQIIDDAGEQSTLVVLAQPSGATKVGAPGSIAALRALVPSSGMRTPTYGALKPFDGGGANWYFDASNLSASVAAYPKVFIAPNSDPSGASGAWRVEPGTDIYAIHYGVGLLDLDTTVDISDLTPPDGSSTSEQIYAYNEEVFYRQAKTAAEFNTACLYQLGMVNNGKKYIKLPAALIFITELAFYGVNPKFQGVFGVNSTNSTMFQSSAKLGTGPVLKVTSSTGTSASRLSGLYVDSITITSKDFFSVPGYNTFTDRRTNRRAFEFTYAGTQYHLDKLYAGGFTRGFHIDELWDGYAGELRAMYVSNPTGTISGVYIGSTATDNVNNTLIDHIHVEFSPFAIEFGFCEHVTVNVLKAESYRLLDATHPVVYIHAECTKLRINSLHCTTNNSTKTHAIWNYAQFPIIDGLWCAGGQDATWPYAGIRWYKAVNPNINCKKITTNIHANRVYAADGTDPEDYSFIFADYEEFNGTFRCSDTYATSSGTVTNINSGLASVGTQCSSDEFHMIVGAGEKSYGPVFYFKGDGAEIKRVTQAAGNKIKSLAGGASFNNRIGSFGSQFQSTSQPVIEVYGKRVVFLSAATAVTQLLGMVGDEITIIANASGCTLVHDSSKLVTNTAATVSMTVGKPYKFVMNSNGKATQV